MRKRAGSQAFMEIDRALRVRNADANSAELLLYDVIGWPWLMAADVRSQLKSIDAETIHVRINSPGGDVFDGMAIYNALLEHEAKIVTHVDGIAASIASVIALAGDEVHMAENAFFMIHNPWTIALGDQHEMRKVADTLEKIAGSIRGTYAKKTGAALPTITEWMDKETWFTAAEAKEESFVDVVEGESEEEDDDVSDRILQMFNRVPDSLRTRAEKPANPKRVLERALRDAGLGRIAAKAIIAGGLTNTIGSERDALDPAVRNEIRKLINNIT